MRGLLAFGTSLVVAGLFGTVALAVYLAVTFLDSRSPASPPPQPPAAASIPWPAGPGLEAKTGDLEMASPASEPPPSIAQGPREITRLRIDRIRLDTEVVPAKFIENDGGTWNIPAFIAGHAEFTAGAGQPGNAVVFGHVTSLTLGNVFQELERVRVGDRIEVLSGDREFDYEVTEVRVVPRTEVSVVEPTEHAAISLITCTGAWLPHLRDYADRLVVRGELAPTG